MNTRTEAFTELYDETTGYNLRHFIWSDKFGHLTGEACPCGPERVVQNYKPAVPGETRRAVVIDMANGESWIEELDE